MAGQHPRTNSLYVGDLNPEVNEGKLMEIFSTVGQINSLRLCRDHHTQRSLGYAYINYNQPEHADKALKTLNFTKIEGRPCRVMWVHRDPWLRKSGKGNIFVKNLPPKTDNKTLFDTFKEYGDILSVKVPENMTYGFVHFKEEKSAIAAIEGKHGKELEGCELTVMKFLPQKERTKEITNLYVKPLPKEEEYSEEELKSLFVEFGEISSCKIAKDEETKASKGFGFVDFVKPEDAKKAINKLNGTDYKGKKLFVGPFQPLHVRKRVLKEKHDKEKFNRWEKFAGTNIYIKNLSEDIDEAKLNEIFGKFGEIKSSMVKIENGIHRGFGFVNYASQEAATKAVTAMNKQVVNGKLLYVALAQSKEERMRKLQDKYNKQQSMQGVYPGGNPPGGFMYPPQPGQGYPGRPVFITQPLVQRPRYYPGAPQNVQRMPNQMMAMQRGRGRGRGNRKGQNPNFKLTANARNHQQAAMQAAGMVPIPQAVMMQQQGNPQFQQMQRQQQQMMANQMAQMRISQPAAQPGPPQAAQQGATPQGPAQAPNLATVLAGMDEGQRKQTIGEILYPKIQKRLEELGKKEQAPKITGMLLEVDDQELLGMIPNDKLLNEKVSEALEVLEKEGEAQDEGAE
mmetsp:Transcript_2118/g.3874  ORF Transcript_2118/g.3874 Transcript_2118/m.3874 type:complete len:624 (+) Transcript_2118:142-2013(+)|eukprot:CAMPEP_0197514772 /NCGR_PEP_ID=MMETSP1318-20131121/114_1 /TAXON_ID=552666 /ORGANISM="Partenskyella glossopodia, Strain RCC365" /LENGTH=623 /DNA_ID=CAMNT_0043062961 /DNA_START=160 /DNA_END=2031 /DNA_ORIENTATION=-